MAPRQTGGSGTAGKARAAARNATPVLPNVRDFTGSVPATFSIEWDVRPAFDFLIALAGDPGSGEDVPAADKTWLKDAIAGLPGADQKFLEVVAHRDLLVHLGTFLVERHEIRTAANVADAIGEADPVQLFRSILMDHPAADTAEVDRALGGDAAAAAAVKSRLHGPGAEPLGRLLDDPAAAHEQVASVLRSWAVAFAPIEARVSSILERDVELREGDRSRLSGVELVEQTTGGIRVVPDGTIERVVLAPSYFGRPFNYLFGGPTWRFAAYPVSDEALDFDPLAPPAGVLRLHRALGDATRLRILKALADKDLYGAELADQLELSKPTVSHHMAQLRAAGLVTAVQAGSAVYYSLRRERLQAAHTDLTRFLVG